MIWVDNTIRTISLKLEFTVNHLCINLWCRNNDLHCFCIKTNLDELNPSYWVGQAVKTIEIIAKTDYLV